MNRTDLTWLRSAVFTASLMLLLAAAIGAKNWPFVLLILAMVVGGGVLFNALFPGTVFLSIALANFVALYVCIFLFFLETNFSQTSEAIQRMSVTLPILAFLAGVCGGDLITTFLKIVTDCFQKNFLIVNQVRLATDVYLPLDHG